MSNLLTVSRMRVNRECKRKHKLMYLDGWRPGKPGTALRFGTLLHTALEAWWKDDGSARLAAALAAIHGKGADPFEQVSAEALMAGYNARWGSDELYEVVAVERTFFAPLLNPETRAPSRTWLLAGKLDVLVRNRETDDRLLVEHKTSTDNIANPVDNYWTKLGMDSQVSHYYLGAESIGFALDGCLYDVLLRPRLEPLKATPVEKRKFTKDGRLYANQRERDETPEEYQARVCADIETDFNKYFQRKEIARTERDMVEYLGDVWDESRMMREAELAERAPRNPEACHRFGQCFAWDICAYGVKPEDHPEAFHKLDDVHPELGLSEVEA
jgi:hypothetical protein